jgi:aminoglycoside phosphotransferase family enzyme/predicted kinase
MTMQTEVESFLGSPSSTGAPVTRIDTHAAIVFLSGNRVLKIKRAIKLPFLDFSTLDRRKSACDAELAVNKPFAPTIYRRVVPITREGDGTLKIDGTGEAVEWALDMVRFDEGATFDKLAERGEMTAALASALADTIAASHAKAAVARTRGWIASIEAIIQQNADAFRASGAFEAVERDEFENLSRRAYATLLPVIERRCESGFVRRCHGDLHLANIALIDKKPVLFDAIEFNETFATIDILHDLAFTLMDLVHYRCIDAANVLLNRYLGNAPENSEAVALLPLSIAMRAAVRANVLLCRSGQRGADPSLADRARSYFSLALSALRPAPACVVAIGGLSGTGKSAAARALAPHIGALPGAVILRSDVIRKTMFGVGELDRLPSTAYRPAVTLEVYARLAAEAATIVKQGHSVIVDAVFAHESERSAIESVAGEAPVPFIGIFLTADLSIRRQRIGQRRADASDATVAIAEAQEEYDLGTLAWTRIDAGGTLEATAALCAALLPGSPRLSKKSHG